MPPSTTGTTLIYDALDRLNQVASGEGTKFLYEGQQIIAEYNGSGALQRRYIPGPGLDNPYVWFEGTGTASNTARWLLGNAFGSIIAVGSTGAANTTLGINQYDEFGVGPSTNLGRFQYKGMAYIPEVGLYHARARTYSQYLGRFMQPDPSDYSDGMNLYAFVHNAPVGDGDPLGRATECREVKGGEFACEVDAPRPPPDDPSPTPPPSDFPTTDPPAPGTDGGGGGGPQPQGSKQVDCDTVLPNGQTVGDVVNGVENLINALAAINPVAGLGAYVGAALPYGPLDFKNNFRGQANATFLSAAGNFAFGAVTGELFGSGRFGSYVGLSGAGVYATVVGKGGPGLPFIAAPYAADPSARQSVPAGVAALCRK